MTPQELAALPYRPNVGVVLANRDGLIFTGQRIDFRGPTHDAAWQMPQGGIDPGETPDQAALRELQEETGVTPDLVTLEQMTADWITYDLPLDILNRVWGGKFRGQKQKWALLRFHGQDGDINIDTDHPEFNAWKWQRPDRLVDEIVEFKRDVYRSVLAELGPHL